MTFRFLKAFIITVIVLTPMAVFGFYDPGTPAGFVNDFGQMLSESEEQALESKLNAFEEVEGNEIAVVTIESLQEDTIENFAVELFSKWGIGKKEHDNGVLLLISRDDREMRIEVGYGLEGALTDLQSYQIIENFLVPNFKEGNYYAGIDTATDIIIDATKGEYEALDKEESTNVDYEALFFLGIFFLMWMASLLGASKSWWAGGVVGGVIGVIIGFVKGFVLTGVISIALFIPLGLLFDYFVSKSFHKHKINGTMPWWIGRGGRGGGGGFGGFGGGMSGGGGASGKW